MSTRRRARSHRRPILLGVAAFLLAVTASLAWQLASGQATSSGDPYAVPIAVDTNPDPNVLETTITAQNATVDVNAPATSSVHAETYNGSIPGPTLIAKVGDTIIVHFVNHLDEATGIHWHGIELPNTMDGTPLTQNMVPKDGTFLYKFKVPRPGIYWYHPHHHSSTNQVFKGLYGMIIVTDPNEAPLIANGTLPDASATKQLVLSDMTVCKASPGNDTQTYAAGLPWVGAGALPAQSAPVPKTLCQSAADGGAAVDESGAARSTSFALGDVPNIQQSTGGQENEGQTVLTNGKNVGARSATQGDPNATPALDSPLSALGAPAAGSSLLDVRPGQGLRLQIVNTSTIRYMRLRLTKPDGTKVDLIRVGGEGGLLDNAVREGGTQSGTGFVTGYTQGEILLPPGSRADVVAAIPASPTTGVMTLWTEDYQRVGFAPNWSNIPTVPVMHLNLTGSPVSPAYTIADGTPLRAATGDPVAVLPASATQLLPASGFSPAKTGKSAPVLPVTLQSGGGSTKVDNVVGTHDTTDYATALHMGSTRYARLGDTLELTVANATQAHHPFHLHGFSMQPLDLTKGGSPTYNFPHEYRDNVDIPPGYTLRFRIRLDDRPQPDGTTPGGGLGRWVFHCHIFFHASLGMISELVVLPPGVPASNGDERPNINTSATSVTVDQGDTASFTGTYNDINGDAVTLSSSVGTVTDNGGGAYTWSFPTGTAASQFVYVTATDPTGARAQMPVQLTINNAPPALTLPGAETVAQGGSLGFDVTATDPNAVDPLALTASGLPAGLTFKDNGDRTGKVSGQVTAPPGAYPAGFTVSDGRNAAVTGNVPITVTPPLLTALVTGTERLVAKKITVGCRFAIPSITGCAATVTRGARQVGRASRTAAAGKASVSVGVPLAKSTRAAVAKSVGGVPVSVLLDAGRTDSASRFTTTRRTKVVAPRVVVTTSFGAYRSGSTKLTNHALSFLSALARKVGTARTIVCTAHPDRGSNSRSVAARRAGNACAALQAAGLKARFSSVGSRRSHDHRLAITILR